MLILARNVEEEVIIFDSMGMKLGSVKVVSVAGQRVKLGFDGPSDVVFLRGEIAHTVNDPRYKRQKLQGDSQ